MRSFTFPPLPVNLFGRETDVVAPSTGIAFTAKMMNPTPTAKGKFSFQKIFTELDYLAGGILQIRSGQQKPMKRAMDNSYVRGSTLPLRP